ncbi:Nuclear envelope integral membrane protein 1 [Nymphon striatum]|nr:Nuclear envelope integral membrane protein 1 [Nymphon striatum]
MHQSGKINKTDWLACIEREIGPISVLKKLLYPPPDNDYGLLYEEFIDFKTLEDISKFAVEKDHQEERRLNVIVIWSFLYSTIVQGPASWMWNVGEKGEKWLTEGAVEKFNETYLTELQVFCHEAENVSLIHTFKTIHFNMLINSDNYEMFDGDNVSSVLHKYTQRSSNWFNLLPWKQKVVSVPTFETYCIGIGTKEPYQLIFSVRWLDYWILIQMIFGVMMFFVADKLSKNVVFYYGSGITIGVFASLLILVFVISKFIPKRNGAYAVMIFGWSLCAYFFKRISENIIQITQDYSMYLLIYVTTASMISFAICYKYGPIGDVKSQNLIKWFIQEFGLFSVANGNNLFYLLVKFRQPLSCTGNFSVVNFLQFRKQNILFIFEYSGDINCYFTNKLDYEIFSKQTYSANNTYTQYMYRLIITPFLHPQEHYIPKKYKKFPPKIKLLSEEEYIQQGSIETEKALEKLRNFCRSPDCNSWKTMSQLNSPIKFAQFIEGSSHLSDLEITSYDIECHDLDNNFEKSDYISEDEENMEF